MYGWCFCLKGRCYARNYGASDVGIARRWYMVRAFFVVASPGLLVRMYRGKSRWYMGADVWIKLVDVSGVEQKGPVAGYCAQSDNRGGSRVCRVDLLTSPVENKRRVRE